MAAETTFTPFHYFPEDNLTQRAVDKHTKWNINTAYYPQLHPGDLCRASGYPLLFVPCSK